jgi:pimeloyl-ACP methyl ester carboxylesterase
MDSTPPPPTAEIMTKPSLPHLRLGTGAPLVVIPGLAGRHGVPVWAGRWMQHQEIVELSGSRSVWSIDRRAGLEHGITMTDLAEEYAHTIRRLFSEPIDIVGVSTGGGIALQLALDFPDLIHRLVLVSSAYRLSDHGRQVQREIATLLREGHPRRAAALFLSNTGATSASRAILSVAGLLAPRIVVGREDADLLVTLDAEDTFDLSGRLASVTAPTLVTGGGNDRFYTAELFADTARGIPGSRLTIYPGAGHIGTQGNRRLVRDILEFLETPGTVSDPATA